MIESNWRRCDKCSGLFFATAAASLCPAGGAHAPSAASSYVLSDGELSVPNTATLVGDSDMALSIVSRAGGNTGVNVLSLGVAPEDNGGESATGVYTETDGAGTALWAAAVDGAAVLARSRTGRGVRGESAGVGDGVAGFSQAGTGVFGEGTQNGVHGKSAAGRAVYGENTAGGDGVGGFSQTGTGTAGVSDSGNGVYGRSNSGMAGFFEGHIQVTGEIRMDGADFAEQFTVPPDVAAGTVMIIGDDGELTVSQGGYDKRVAGVVAGAGRYRPGLVLDTAGEATGDGARRPISLMGKAYCMVDAGAGSVGVGDLLTTADRPGCAMRATDRDGAFGAVIGKALAPLNEGQQLIPILVALQ